MLAAKVRSASTFLARFRGLMGVATLPASHGLLLDGDNAIHTFFMRFPIDVVFLDAECRVVHATAALRPWRVSRIVWRAEAVLELPAGTLEQTGTRVGDLLAIDRLSS
jgi:uncharacterized membrane protein (UPF0127 family)